MFFLNAGAASANQNSYVTVVNPIRGEDFWSDNFDIWEMVDKQVDLLTNAKLPATFLLRPDVYFKAKTLEKAKLMPQNFEKGIFLEITPSWAERAKVAYHTNGNWHAAGSVFLTGYSQEERRLFIDSAFDGFKNNFGYYPKSVGAWWVDSYSIGYMYEKYHISSVLIVADQYSTDNYQVWGQYFGYPYYPSRTNALFPAQELEVKIPVVMMQWAARDPVNGYGKGVEESTLSLQANDYMDYHDLSTDYFERVLKTYLDQPLNKVNQVVVGIENSYFSDRYFGEYQKEINLLVNMQKSNQIAVTNMQEFSDKYQQLIIGLSPSQVIVSGDPLGGDKKAVWFMNPYYRASWVDDGQGARFRDVRQYINNQREVCFEYPCAAIDFATGAVRVLDQVTNGLSYELDEGKVNNFRFEKVGDEYVLTYTNAAGKNRSIKFMPRDIKIDDQISTIDGLILRAQVRQQDNTKQRFGEISSYRNDYTALLVSAIKFVIFVLVGVALPGLGFTYLVGVRKNTLQIMGISLCFGLVGIVLFQYYFGRFWNGFIYGYILLTAVMGCYYFSRLGLRIKFGIFKHYLIEILIICLGSVFWVLSVWKSGLFTEYGLGFWGPNGHDGVWHLAVANSLSNNIPPVNPIFPIEILKNYHYLFDVLLEVSHAVTAVPLEDLLFRFIPLLFSVSIGILVLAFGRELFNKTVVILSLLFVYFAGSFGWIIEYFRSGTLSGESAFWVNQPVSVNLNPPFAFSLLVLFAIFILTYNFLYTKNRKVLVGIMVLGGSLVGIKIYAFILLIFSLGIFSLIKIIKRDFRYLLMTLGVSVIGLCILLPNYDLNNLFNSALSETFVFSPWWFVHTMLDYPDRVGWLKLSQARSAYFERGDWFKFLFTESLGLVIFIVGNLGVRFIGLLGIFHVQKIWRSDILRLVFLYTVFSVSIPLLFIQKGTAWNTIQFFYYALPFTAFAAAWILYKLVYKLPKVAGLLVIIVIVAIGSINSFERAISYYQGVPHAVVPYEELDALKVIRTSKYGIVLTVPYDKDLKRKLETPWPLFAYDSTAYVSALSGRPVYIEDEMQNEILGNDYVKRRVASKDFFGSPNRQFLDKNNIEYIYLPKIYNISIPAEQIGFEQIFENKAVRVYQRVSI